MHHARSLAIRLPAAFHVRYGHKLVTRQLGDPLKVLELQEQKRPKLSSPDNVLVGVLAANINPSDVLAIQGVYPTRPKNLPAVFGLEGFAQVLEVGSNVKHLKVGDLVWPSTRGGVYQTYVECNANQALVADKRLTVQQGASLLVNPLTAYFMIKMGKLQKGDTLVQNVANSAVGQCVVQLAREWGINTINIVRPRKDIEDVRKMLTKLGGTAVITDEELQDESAMKSLVKQVGKPKLAFEAVGGKQVINIAHLLNTNGHLVVYGSMSNQPLVIPGFLVIFQNLKVSGFWLSNVPPKEWPGALSELADMSVRGKLLPAASEVRPATDWQKAFEISTNTGKAASGSVQHRPKQILSFYDPKKPE